MQVCSEVCRVVVVVVVDVAKCWSNIITDWIAALSIGGVETWEGINIWGGTTGEALKEDSSTLEGGIKI